MCASIWGNLSRTLALACVRVSDIVAPPPPPLPYAFAFARYTDILLRWGLFTQRALVFKHAHALLPQRFGYWVRW